MLIFFRIFFQFPSSAAEWKQIAKDYEDIWNFPNCVGAVDGKHVMIVPPTGAGSYYYNYKGHHSLVLMAIVNAKYEFIMCDFGINGRISDGGVMQNTAFHEKLCSNELRLPTPKPPKYSNTPLPYVFIGDEAFSLRSDFLKPFNQRELTHDRKIFSYRLSRARRVVENVFGIMASRFRIFHVPINMKLENIDTIVMACCVLHNYLRRTQGTSYASPDITEHNGNADNITNETENAFISLERGHNRRAGEEAKQVREKFLMYFNGEGALDWQEEKM